VVACPCRASDTLAPESIRIGLSIPKRAASELTIGPGRKPLPMRPGGSPNRDVGPAVCDLPRRLVYPSGRFRRGLPDRSHLEGFDYDDVARRRFDPIRDAAFTNRFIYERLPRAAIPWLFRRAAATRDMRRRLGRHWKPTGFKSTTARLTWRRFAKTRLNHRDRACHSPTCDCVWCTHGDQQMSAQTERTTTSNDQGGTSND
jgi:hypothetical protein